MKQKLETLEEKKFFPRYKSHIFTVSINFIFHRKPWFFSFFPIPYYILFFLIYDIKIFFCKCWFFRIFCKSPFSLRNFRTSAFSLFTRQTDTVLRINVSCKRVFLSTLSLQTVCRFSFIPNSLKNTFCSFSSTVLASCASFTSGKSWLVLFYSSISQFHLSSIKNWSCLRRNHQAGHAYLCFYIDFRKKKRKKKGNGRKCGSTKRNSEATLGEKCGTSIWGNCLQMRGTISEN